MPLIEKWKESWELVEKLGEGGQGIVFKAKHRTTGAFAVIKLILPEFESDAKARIRFRREINNLNDVDSEGGKVPTIFEANWADFENPTIQLYVAMAHIEGESLHRIIGTKGVRLDLPTALAVMNDLCMTMSIAHSMDIIHRDIKPKNIIVKEYPKTVDVVLLDFGVSHKADEATVTGTSETIKNEFLALPECTLEGGDKRDKRSDLANLCAIFHYCLTGHVPKFLEQTTTPNRRPNALIPTTLGNPFQIGYVNFILDRGLKYYPDQRFQSASELQTALSAVSSAATEPIEDISSLAMRLSEELELHDRPTKLLRYKAKIKSIVGEQWTTATKDLRTLGLGNYRLQVGYFGINDKIPSYEDMDQNNVLMLRLTTTAHPICVTAFFKIACRDTQCSLLRKRGFGQADKNDMTDLIEQWAAVGPPFDADSGPNLEMITKCLKDTVVLGIGQLHNKIRGT